MNSLLGNVFTNGTSNLSVVRTGNDFMATISNITSGMSVPLRLVPGTSNILASPICGTNPSGVGFCSRVSVGPGNFINIPGFSMFRIVTPTTGNMSSLGTLTVSQGLPNTTPNVILRSIRGSLPPSSIVTISGQESNTMNALTRNVNTIFSNITSTQGQIISLPGTPRNRTTRMNLVVSSGSVSNVVSFNYTSNVANNTFNLN